MAKKRETRIDRRSGMDRRKVYDLDYFSRGGIERRRRPQRRSLFERRKQWLRVSEWRSVFISESDEADAKKGGNKSC